MWKNQTRMDSFRCAFRGFRDAMKQEKNLRIHVLLSISVLIIAAFSGLTRMEWLFIFVAIIMVIGSELLNSAIEAVVDLITDEYNILAKYAKDVAAALVVCCALGAVVIGAMIFAPRIFALIFG